MRTSWSRVLRLGLASVILLAAPAARADIFDRTVGNLGDALQNVTNLRPSDATDWRLGVGPYVAPAFEGSREYKVNPAPMISVHYRDVMQVNNNDIDFTAFDHVIDFGDAGLGKVNFGPAVNLDFGRSEHDSGALRGLGNVGFSLELGGFAEFRLGPLFMHLEGSQDVASGHKGLISELVTSLTLLRRDRFAIGTTAVLSWASAAYNKSFFGITGTQSARSGLPVYRPGSGMKDGRLLLLGSYDFSRHWELYATAGYERLFATDADSPLVKQRGSANQGTLATFVVYKF